MDSHCRRRNQAAGEGDSAGRAFDVFGIPVSFGNVHVDHANILVMLEGVDRCLTMSAAANSGRPSIGLGFRLAGLLEALRAGRFPFASR
jgi:hypothetical protein